jgi:prepilin-type N-terminal cleavage/methylation domain-containing protein
MPTRRRYLHAVARQRGFSLVEIIIGLALSAVAALGASSILSRMKKTELNSTRIHDEGELRSLMMRRLQKDLFGNDLVRIESGKLVIYKAGPSATLLGPPMAGDTSTTPVVLADAQYVGHDRVIWDNIGAGASSRVRRIVCPSGAGSPCTSLVFGAQKMGSNLKGFAIEWLSVAARPPILSPRSAAICDVTATLHFLRHDVNDAIVDMKTRAVIPARKGSNYEIVR